MNKSKIDSLKELAFLFLKLGVTGFGGPAALIAIMQDEIVQRRKWLSNDEFIDLIGAVNLIPGPNATEIAIHVGRLRAGFIGLIVAGACFFLPATIIVTIIAYLYVRFGSLPAVSGILYGIKPVVIAIVVQALWRLGRTALKNVLLMAVGIAVLILSFAGFNEILILLGAGVIVALLRWLKSFWQSPPATTFMGIAPVGLLPLFLVFLKVGAVLFGTGYTLLAFLHDDLVTRYGWMTESVLLDAIAVGQVTPGPVLTTAAFIGYVLAGIPGAAIATIGIFLPSFFYVALSAPIIQKMHQSGIAGAFLDGVNVAALALVLFVTWTLGHAAIIDIPTAVIVIASIILLFAFRLNSLWLIAGGLVIGLLKSLIS